MTSSSATPRPTKPPRLVLTATAGDRPHTLYAFPPNRDTLGGTAYFLMESVNILIDCPAWDEPTQTFLAQQGGVQFLFLTHRDSIGQAQVIQKSLGCAIVLQEQEAYLLPSTPVIPFTQDFALTPATRALWTPGHTPGSACLYHSGFGGVLFTGRHLLPTPQGTLAPIKTAKTFHWPRQQRHVQRLIDEFTDATLHWICPGAHTGFLRGKLALADGYQHLQQSLTDA